MGVLRYTTINCRRVYRWYPTVGPAERAVSSVDCVRVPTAGVAPAPIPAFVATASAAVTLAKPAIAVAAAVLLAGAGVGGLVVNGARNAANASNGGGSALVLNAPAAPTLPTLADVVLPERTDGRAAGATSVPEPGSLALLGTGLVVVAGMMLVRRRA